jgi:hypothetical protein
MSVTRVQLVGNVSTGASFAGIVTATSFIGNVTGTASTASFATTSFGLSGSPNITVGTIAATNINASGIITSTSIVVSAGTTSAPSISPSGDSNTGIFFPSADTIAASTNGTGRLFINNGGDIGVGTASPVSRLHVTGGDSVFGSGNLTRILNASQVIDFTNAAQDTYVAGRLNGLNLKFYTNTGSGIDITSAGLVGINTTSPDSTLTVNGTARVQSAASFAGINIQNSNDSSVSTTTSFLDTSNNLGTIDGHIFFEHLTTGGSNAIIATTPAGDRAVDRRVSRLSISFAGTTTLNSATSTAPFIAQIAGTERARIDSSGRLLVGTSSARANFYNQASTYAPKIQLEGADPTNGGTMMSAVCAGGNSFSGYLILGKHRGSVGGTPTIVNTGDPIGSLSFQAGDGSEMVEAATITAEVDGTPGANDMPGRIVLSTTADGASSPTERMRIDSAGNIITTGTFVDPAITGTILEDVFTITDGAAFEINPGNGSVQLITLGASRTPKATNMVAGESITLMVDDGSAYTLTWSDATFGGSGVVWKTNAGVAPTLNTTGYTVIVLWKVSTQVYGARVGDA